MTMSPTPSREPPLSPEKDDDDPSAAMATRKAFFPADAPPAAAAAGSGTQQQEAIAASRGARGTADRWEPREDEVRALAMRDFEVIGVLGVGTYGVVKLARHVASGASVALKVLSKEHVVSMRQEKHILRERMVHLQLKHPFVARLYGTFQDADCLYLVIEYLPGGELWSLVYSDFDNNDGSDDNGSCDAPNDAAPSNDEGASRAAEQEEQSGSQEAEQEKSSAGSLQPQLHVAKDTEARVSSPTESEESGEPLELPSLTKRLTLKVVLDEASTQQSTSSERDLRIRLPVSPCGRRSLSSPAAAHAMRLDAKSRGMLRNNHGGLKEDHAVFYLACILSALEYLHAQKLLYRDLKLENLVLDRAGYPKVLDFGFAKPNATGKTARNMTLCGSMDYMAPEILLHEPHDQRVDIWSFGVIMYELLLGKTPFYHENPREQGRKITTEPVVFPDEFPREHPEASDLIRKLLVKSPRERLSSMRELKSHAFFTRYFAAGSAAWEALERRERAAPFVPKLDGPFDTSFFETLDGAAQDELEDFVQPYFEDGSHIFSAF